MKKKVPGHGRSRDEEPAGRAGPRRICQSPFQFGFPFLYPPSEVRIWRFGQILTSLERFRVVIGLSSGFYLHKEFRGSGFLLHKEFRRSGFYLLYTKNSGAARAIYLRNPIRKRYSSQKIFPLRGQFIHCDFIYTKNSGGRPCRKSLFY